MITPIRFFAVCVEPHRIVVAEIQDRAVAAVLDSGKQVLLGTVQDLNKLAQRLGRQLVTFSCTSPARVA
jgi:hypothetical protein